MTTVTYPFDPTGSAVSNLVTNEQHAVTEANYRDYFFIVPTFAPFFANNFKISLTAEGITRELVEGVDFDFALPFVAAQRSIGQPIYGGITLTNNITTGIITLEQYQTLGGDWIADQQYVYAQLAEKIYNPRITVWDMVTNVQTCFPPINHPLDIADVYGQQDLINAVLSLASSLAENPADHDLIIKHLADNFNPHHVTKDQVGLGNVEDLAVVTSANIAARNFARQFITYDTLQAAFESLGLSTGGTMIGGGYLTSSDLTTILNGLGLIPVRPVLSPVEISNLLSASFKVTTNIVKSNNYNMAGVSFVFEYKNLTLDSGWMSKTVPYQDNVVSYSSVLTGLTAGHTYMVRVRMTDVNNNALGLFTNSVSVSTVGVTKPTLVNPTITNLTATSFTINSGINPGQNYNTASLVLKLYSRPANNPTFAEVASIPFGGQYTASLTNLVPSSAYVVKAVLIDSNNTSFSVVSPEVQVSTMVPVIDADSSFDIVGVDYVGTSLVATGATVVNNTGVASVDGAKITSVAIQQQAGQSQFTKLRPTISFIPKSFALDKANSTTSSLHFTTRIMDPISIGDQIKTVLANVITNATVGSISNNFWRDQYWNHNPSKTSTGIGGAVAVSTDIDATVNLVGGSVFTTAGYVYYFGGMNTATSLPDPNMYRAPIDAAGVVGAWTNMGTMGIANATQYQSRVVVTTNWVYLLGGVDYSAAPPVTTNLIYKAPINPDGTIGSWSQDTFTLPRDMTSFQHAFANTGTNDVIYLFAGEQKLANGSTTYLNTVDEIVLNTDGTIASITGGVTTTAITGKYSNVFTSGTNQAGTGAKYINLVGYVDATGTVFSDIHTVDLDLGVGSGWDTTTNKLPSVGEAFSLVVTKDKFLVAGGNTITGGSQVNNLNIDTFVINPDGTIYNATPGTALVPSVSEVLPAAMNNSVAFVTLATAFFITASNAATGPDYQCPFDGWDSRSNTSLFGYEAIDLVSALPAVPDYIYRPGQQVLAALSMSANPTAVPVSIVSESMTTGVVTQVGADVVLDSEYAVVGITMNKGDTNTEIKGDLWY